MWSLVFFGNINIVVNVIVLHCYDGIKNGDETGVDCGGSCEACKGMHYHVYNNIWSLSAYLTINRYWYYNYSYFKVLARILLYTKYQTQGVSWTLSSNCASNREVAFNVKEDQFYEEECALEIGGSYELSCNSYTGKGWSGALLLIENKAYCQNFREGFNEVTTIKITGK